MHEYVSVLIWIGMPSFEFRLGLLSHVWEVCQIYMYIVIHDLFIINCNFNFICLMFLLVLVLYLCFKALLIGRYSTNCKVKCMKFYRFSTELRKVTNKLTNHYNILHFILENRTFCHLLVKKRNSISVL